MVGFFLFSLISFAVWLDDIYGNPPKSYFLAHQKFLEWGLQQNQLPESQKKVLEACLKKVDGWYLPGSRHPQFEVRVGIETIVGVGGQRENKVRYRWICRDPKSTKTPKESYMPGSIPGHPLEALISHHWKKSEKEYSFELKAYMDWDIAPELLSEIRKIHEEFGFLADSWHQSHEFGLEVAFP